jgi:putative ABC transport system permease protein
MQPDGMATSALGRIAAVRAGLWLWLRFSLRRAFTNPFRVTIAVVAVALATTLVSAVLRVSFASINSFERGISGGNKPYHVLISPVGGRLDLETLGPCLKGLAAKAEVLAVRREAGVVSFSSIEKPARITAFYIYGAESEKREFGDRLISSDLADYLRLGNSGIVTLKLQGESTQLELFRPKVNDAFDGAKIIAGQSDVVLALSDLSAIKYIDSVALRFYQGSILKEFNQIGDTWAALTRSWLSSCLAGSAPVRVESINAPVERGEQLLAAYRFNIMIMAAITALVCALLISQATQISLRGILRELAILRTLGGSPGECLALVLIEAGAVSFLGALLGLTLGGPVVSRISGFLSATAEEIYNVNLSSFPATNSLVNALLISLGMAALGVFAALIGAKRVFKLAPYRGARREQRQIHRIDLAKSILVALFANLALLSVLVSLAYLETVLLAYVSIALVLLAAASVVPVAFATLPRLIHLLRRFTSFRLAESALRESGSSFVLSAIAACISVALMVGLALMVGSFRETLRGWSITRLAGDIFISSDLSGAGNESRVESSVVQQIKGVSGVKIVVPYFELNTELAGRSLVVGGVDLKLQCLRGVYRFVSGSCLGDGKSWAAKALISESATRKRGLSMGSRFIVQGREFEAVGVIQEFGTEEPLIVIDIEEFLSMYPGHNPDSLTIDVRDPKAAEEIKTQIRASLPANLAVRDQRELLNLVETLFNRTFRVTESVRWIVFAIALLGLISTATQHIWERRREIKIAEVIGVEPNTTVAALALETAVITTATTAIGLVAGLGIGWCLTKYINPLVFGWSLSFELSKLPVIEAVVFLSAVSLMTAVAALVMVRKIVCFTRLEDE